MWFFLVSDALTFGGLLTAYGFARHSVDSWPVAEKVFRALPFSDGDWPLIYVALMTFILIISSVTMVLAVEAGHRLDKKGVTKWLLATVLGGAIFVGSQAWEWSHFIHGSHHGAVLTEQGWAYVAGLEYQYDENGHVLMDGHDPAIQSLRLQFIDGGQFMMSGAEALEAYNTAERNLDGKLILENGLGVPVNIVGSDDNVTSVELLVEGTIYREMEGNVDSENWGELLALYEGASSQIQGANLTENEYAPNAPAYADFFFFITGFHGFHVFSGVVINLLILIQVLRGVYDKRGHFEMVEKSGLYWHFVDLVWVFVFTFFYLL
ncbi:MAG TPA: cytochrome oxidase subunit III [Flavobacteriales bacterium]|nr:cytochrome oxidase subunit III [Crocinitomicaceae bacterium]HAE30583.1 cytochrome oxidase subunit III [Flavobacteriales bacterium]